MSTHPHLQQKVILSTFLTIQIDIRVNMLTYFLSSGGYKVFWNRKQDVIMLSAFTRSESQIQTIRTKAG